MQQPNVEPRPWNRVRELVDTGVTIAVAGPRQVHEMQPDTIIVGDALLDQFVVGPKRVLASRNDFDPMAVGESLRERLRV